MGEAYLGSIVAESGAKWLETDKDYIDDLIEQAVDEARSEALRMLDILKQDFLA
jgi:hypothetical protein